MDYQFLLQESFSTLIKEASPKKQLKQLQFLPLKLIHLFLPQAYQLAILITLVYTIFIIFL